MVSGSIRGSEVVSGSLRGSEVVSGSLRGSEVVSGCIRARVADVDHSKIWIDSKLQNFACSFYIL